METDLQRWTARRKAELILARINGEPMLADAFREYDIKPSDVEEWTATYLKAGERGLKINADEEQAEHERDRERELKELRANVSELVLELDARRNWHPLTDPTRTAS